MGQNRTKYDGFLSQSQQKELWLYQSCMSHGCGGTVDIGNPSDSDQYFTGWPTYMIDASAVRNRSMEWISFLEDATGIYWESAFAFNHDAREPVGLRNGDGIARASPARIGGSTDIPVASIRLEDIREGMEDYEHPALRRRRPDDRGEEDRPRLLPPRGRPRSIR